MTAAPLAGAHPWAAQPWAAQPWATLPGPAAELTLLALGLLVTAGRPGRARLRELAAAPVTAARSPVPTLRGRWVAAAAVAASALTWSVSASSGTGSSGTGWAAGWAAAGAAVLAGLATALLGGWVARAAASRSDRVGTVDGGALAGCWELVAVCLQAGLPVAGAVSAATAGLPGPVGDELRRVAGLLALGADPATAWAGARDLPALAAFARAAGRSASTGAALAHVARAEAERLRADLLDVAQARAQRAAVLIAGPLGLCFLPAFLVLGIAPVVIGLGREVLARW